MNRQDFLKSLFLAVAAARAPELVRADSLWTDDDPENWEEGDESSILRRDFVGPSESNPLVRIHSFQALGYSQHSTAARALLCRKDDTLLNFGFNTMGGNLVWRARLNDEIIIPLQDLRVVVPGKSQIGVAYTEHETGRDFYINYTPFGPQRAIGLQ